MSVNVDGGEMGMLWEEFEKETTVRIYCMKMSIFNRKWLFKK